MQRNRGLFLILNIAVLVGLGFLVLTALRSVSSTQMSWSQAKDELRSGRVERVVFDDPDVLLIFKGGTEDAPAKTANVVKVEGDESFMRILDEEGIEYQRRRPNACMDSGAWIWLLLAVVIFWFVMTRREGGVPPGVATFGKSQAKLAPEEGTGVSFDDVAGLNEAIEELQEVVQFLKTPEKFTALGGKIPKGVLLVGPPGTGKTLIARAVAGEADVPFFSMSGSSFVEMFVGVGAARVRDLFKKAAEHAPCIIFIDELDAVGKTRGGSAPVGGNDEREQTLNQLLVEMDGFDGRKGIIILAATNRPEILDPALLRAGRFDRQVMVDRPDLKGRRAILEVHAREVTLDDDVDLDTIARMTPGLAGADLANVLNEAALLAARKDKKAIETEDIKEAIERIVAGLELKSRRIGDAERRIVAYHESGHAICGAACPGVDPVQKISIIPRGIGALGYTLYTPVEDKHLVTKAELEGQIVSLYGGRAAEQIVFGDITTGASDDIRRASQIARDMVTRVGMSDLGPVDYGAARQSPFGIGGAYREVVVSEETSQKIDDQVREILDAGYASALRILESNRDLLERMSQTLLETEVLEGQELSDFLAEVARLEGSAIPSIVRVRRTIDFVPPPEKILDVDLAGEDLPRGGGQRGDQPEDRRSGPGDPRRRLRLRPAHPGVQPGPAGAHVPDPPRDRGPRGPGAQRLPRRGRAPGGLRHPQHRPGPSHHRLRAAPREDPRRGPRRRGPTCGRGRGRGR